MSPPHSGQACRIVRGVPSGLLVLSLILASARRFDQFGSLEITVRSVPDSTAPGFADGETDPIVHLFNRGDPVNLALPAATDGDGGRRYNLIHHSGSTLAELGLAFNGADDIRTLSGRISGSVPLQSNVFTYRVNDFDTITAAGDRDDLMLRITVGGGLSFGTIIPAQIYITGTAISGNRPRHYPGGTRVE